MIDDPFVQKAIGYSITFGSEHGSKVLDDLAMICHANAPTYERHDRSGRQTAFNEGKRTVYLHIKRMMDIERSMELVTEIRKGTND